MTITDFEAAWQAFLGRGLPPRLTALQKRHLRLAFYAGASASLRILLEPPADLDLLAQEDAATRAEWLRAWQQQLQIITPLPESVNDLRHRDDAGGDARR